VIATITLWNVLEFHCHYRMCTRYRGVEYTPNKVLTFQRMYAQTHKSLGGTHKPRLVATYVWAELW